LGVFQLILGILFWAGYLQGWTILHILTGSLFTGVFLYVVFRAFKAGEARWLVAIGLIWAIGLPAFGLLQRNPMFASYPQLARVLHLLCGVGAIGMIELFVRRMLKNK
jgi:hypothetical protein